MPPPPSPLICPASPTATKKAGEGDYIVEKVDPFEPLFAEYVVEPLQRYIPTWINPNHITLSNIVIRVYMLYNAWLLAEEPQALNSHDYFSKSCLCAFLFILTEVVDDLDGCHARKTQQVLPLLPCSPVSVSACLL